MWASCCGLLNEVIRERRTAVQGLRTGLFKNGAKRWLNASERESHLISSDLLYRLLSLQQHICCDCKKSFCALCSVLQENLRCCATCHLLRSTAFQRPRLMQLRVKDLRQYLLLRNIPTDTCREKEDLVDLVLCHQGEEEEEDDTDSLHSRAASPPTSEQSVLSASQGDALSPSDSSGTNSQPPHIDISREDKAPSSTVTPERIRASLSDLDNEEAIENLSVRQLKEILARNFVNYSGCCEKWELLERVHRLYRENEQNRKSSESFRLFLLVSSQLAADDNLCRICMDAIIDCVLLECGHMVTCTKCGKRMSECPICRQYVVRAVHVFKS
uniref:RING-type domain-containing protein n=1 Tax=Mola mola TaxID=94237 RepID=A0A3Q3WR12_MOLML